MPRHRAFRCCWLFFCMLPGALAATAEPVSYSAVTPEYKLQFPLDHGSHPSFHTEWWYVTGWLEDERGVERGFQITFFRSRPGIDEANPSRFAARQLLFAHAAISDVNEGRLLRDEKSARAGFTLAEAAENELRVWIDDWTLQHFADEQLLRAQVAANDFALQLEMRLTQPPLLEGEQGFSQKAPDAKFASYYYSLPQLTTTGTVSVRGKQHKVRGVAWLDHEWSSEVLDQNASGWDWIGLNLDDGTALMALRMRDRAGQPYWASATSRAKDGAPQTLTNTAISWSPLRSWRSPRTQIEYPIEWRVAVGDRVITLKPLMDDQENDARGSTGTVYWEGAVQAFDRNNTLVGRGYLELTGYNGRVRL